MNTDELKQKIVQTYKLSSKAIDKVFEEAEKRIEIFRQAGLSEELLDKRKEMIITSMLIKKTNSKAEDFEGMFFIDTGIIERNANRINRILEKFEKDPIEREKLLASGEVKIINDKPVVIDIHKEIYGKENKNYGKPLIVEKTRRLDGVIMKDGKIARVSLKLRNDSLNEEVPLFKIVRFKANTWEENKEMLFLESGTIEIVGDATNILEIIFETYKDNLICISETENRYEKILKKEAPTFIVVKGIIDSINLEKQNPSIILREEISLEEMAYGKHPEKLHIKVDKNFDGMPYTECVVFGDLWKVGDNENKLLGMTARGYYCPVKAVKTEKIQSMEEVVGDDEW